MKVSMTYDFDDDELKALAHSHARTGKATREECISWMYDQIFTGIQDLVDDYLKSVERQDEIGRNLWHSTNWIFTKGSSNDQNKPKK